MTAYGRAMRWVVPCLLIASLTAAERFTLAPAGAQERGEVGIAQLFIADPHPERMAVTMATAGGEPVPCRVLFAAEGEPLLVQFDCTHRSATYVATAAPGPRDDGWEGRAGLVAVTRPRTAQAADSWKQVAADFTAPPLGCAILPAPAVGVNPSGPSRDVALEITGWFHAPQDGVYRFSVVGNDGLWLTVGDRSVAAWPGWHNSDGGKRGQHGGTITLKAGQHRLRLANVVRGDVQVQVGWQPPGAPHPVAMPASAFAPVRRYAATPLGGPPLVEWRPEGHATVGDGLVCESAFRLVAPDGADCQWRFDDGGRARGAEVRHVWAQPGLRTVRVTVSSKGGPPVEIERRVLVRPHWEQAKEWDDAALAKRVERLRRLDAAAMPGADLAASVALADSLRDAAWLTALGGEALARADDATLLHRLGFLLQGASLRRYDLAERCWRAALARADAVPAVRAQTAMHLAGLLLHVQWRAAEAAALLDGIAADALDAGDRRLLVLYRGDVALAAGDREGAEARYRAAGDTIDPADRVQVARRRARLEAAKVWLARGEADEAERVVREIEWETPRERAGVETALLQAEVHLQRQEPLRAISRVRLALVAVGGDARRADLLFALARALRAAGDPVQARAAVAALRKDHPYSEAAAKAGDLE